MAYTIPTVEPSAVAAGDSVTWKKSFNDYPAGDGWELSYQLVSRTGRITITAAASGDDHLISEAATTTKTWAAGDYSWQAYVTLGAERHLIGEGSLTVRPNFAAVTALDDRSHAAKVVAAIEAVLEGRATQAHMQYRIGERQVQYIPIAELLVLRDRYRTELRGEEDAQRAARGLPTRNKIQVRF